MGQVTLCDIRDEALDAGEVLAALPHDAAGGLVLFIGRVRDHDGGTHVESLHYSAHPTATERLREVCDKIARDHDVHQVAAVHRVGDLEIGDIAVIVATNASHRGASFEASRALIDELKDTVPIWKHQVFADGSEEWVGTP